MLYGGEVVDIVFKSGSLSAVDAANSLAKVFNLNNEYVEYYRDRIPFAHALREIKNKKRKSFNIASQSFHAHFSELTAHGIQVINVKNKSGGDFSELVKLVEHFCGIEGFTQACVMNQAYNFWQNAEDPIEYEAGGRIIGNLPMISNGLPDPLQKMVVDTSGNPGRRILRDGYIEMIGSLMWFGVPFWGHVAEQWRPEIIRLRGCLDYLRGECVRIKLSEKTFNFDTPRKLQEDLRCLVYGTDSPLNCNGSK